MNQDVIDARRYRWLRDSESINGPRITIFCEQMQEHYYPSPVLSDEEIDGAMAADPRYTITAKGRELLEGK